MAGIPRQTISRIIETADILEVISSRIELKKEEIFWALCPFHDEKTTIFIYKANKFIVVLVVVELRVVL